MNSINNAETVRKQYESAAHLNTRISIHDKYSTNKTGFGNWIFSNYEIENGANLLELGCGTGNMWIHHDAEISRCASLILSDLSEGMTEAAAKNLSGYDNIRFQRIDAQQIPFPDQSFDTVIANMMLYHVPDLPLALREIRRVLKNGGTFYCATFGEHGIMEYLSSLLSEYGVEDRTSKNFTLQNGESILRNCFGHIIRKDYEDSLAVTNLDDLIAYIYSLTDMSTLNTVPEEQVKQILMNHTENGILHVPKEYGMFICKK